MTEGVGQSDCELGLHAQGVLRIDRGMVRRAARRDQRKRNPTAAHFFRQPVDLCGALAQQSCGDLRLLTDLVPQRHAASSAT